MRRLSKSISELRLSYDVVVVGSGYGGGVAASRLARCGKKVCVLERGKEFTIGNFPDRPLEAQREFQITSGGNHIGSRLGLYDLRMGDDINVFVGCGLGGTSLINANVSLTLDPRVWEDSAWPAPLVGDAALAVGEERARRMLRPVPYPNETPLPKLLALEKSAEALGKKAERPPINVTFSTGANHAGVVQPACTLCGDCCSGCNVGSKNTVQMTYLPDAVNHGAEIFTGTLVRSVRKERGKWRIFFELLGHDREKFGVAEQSITADIVVLSAGTLGSTEILLRSREEGLPLSEQLGQKFTGNGDVLAFGYNNDVPINGIGFGHPPQVDIDPVGPCISGIIDFRDAARFEDGIIIEEGSIPSGLAPLLPALMAGGSLFFGEDTDFGFADKADETARGLQSLFLGAYKGAANRTQTFLVMSHDSGAGEMRLEEDRLVVKWEGAARQPIFESVNAKLKAATAATGGTHIKNPMSHSFLGENVITVHPLGGCTMGEDRVQGVVNHKCQVFDCEPAEGPGTIHRGLYVCDGSVVPRPLGVNPLLTITSLAERAMIYMAKDYGWSFDDAPNPDAPTIIAGAVPEDEALPAGVEFTERMAGYILTVETGDYERAFEAGKNEDSSFSFTGTILIADVDKFVDDENHTGTIIGTVECPALSPEPLDITEGIFNLMWRDKESVETRRFDYRMVLAARDGSEYYFKGHKVVRDDPGIDVWKDTTTLFVEILRGRDGQHGLHACGILTIHAADLLNQMRTLKGIHGKNTLERLNAVARFGKVFAGAVYGIYGGILAPTKRYDPGFLRKKRELRAAAPEIHLFRTEDNKVLRLTRYQGGDKGPVVLSHGLGVSGGIFTLDTIDTNLVEYLNMAGYDCWVLDYRASIDLQYCRERWTADDVAAYDYPAAVAKVRELTGRDTVQMLVHCFGATTFFMAMMTGLQNVRSAVVSQIAIDVLIPWWPQRLLAHLRTPSLLDTLGIDAVNARAETYDKFWERALDKLTQIIVPFQGEERTRSATSNRITALYGPLYELDQLNQATVDYGLPETFGAANIDAFKQLALIARTTHIVASDGSDRYLPHLDHLALPISFIHGAENACFKPESTERTLDRLVTANGAEWYDRHVIPNYGHIDCIFGKNAARDVYPHMLSHLEKTAEL